MLFTMIREIPSLCEHVHILRVGGQLYCWPTVDFPFLVSFQVTQEAVLESWLILRGGASHKNTTAHFKEGKGFK